MLVSGRFGGSVTIESLMIAGISDRIFHASSAFISHWLDLFLGSSKDLARRALEVPLVGDDSSSHSEESRGNGDDTDSESM